MTQAYALNSMRSMGDFEAMRLDDERMARYHHVFAQQSMSEVYPAGELQVEFVEKTEAYWLIAKLPGIQQDDITIRVDGGVFTILGEWGERSEDDNGAGQRKRPQRAFARQFKLSAPVRADAITMAYIDGELTVCAPKLETAPAHALAESV